MNVFFATHDGHTALIASRLAEALEKRGVEAKLRDLAHDFPSAEEIQSPAPCVLLAAIRYGFHLPAATRLLRRLARTNAKPFALISVNLTARKPQKRTATTNAYLRHWIERTGALPVYAEALAGKLDYPRYRAFDRLMIRLIMTITGGPTDPKAVVDFTPWERIDALADKIAEMGKIS
jgi:menaquinone-dependent protoporphyrinogen oxidase